MNAKRQNLLIQFTKAPSAGQVKTRLAPALSQSQRRELHCAMTDWLCQTLRQTCDGFDLWVAGDSEDAFIDRLHHDYKLGIHQQMGEDLGQRLAQAIAQGLQDYNQVIVIGSDCPFVDSSYIGAAIKLLASHDVVLGPATDGGYVLLGLKQLQPALFTGIDWSTDRVLNQTVAAAEHQRLTVALLPALNDIDQPQDMATLSAPHLPEKLRRFADFST